MRVGSVSVTGVGRSAPFPLDRSISPMNIGLIARVAAPATYTIQYTNDDVNVVAPGSIVWTDVPFANLVGGTGNQQNQGNLVATALSINQTAGAGSTTLTVNQVGK